VSAAEFKRFGFLFNFGQQSVNKIFSDFDISGDKELDYDEFRIFTLAAIDKQKEIDEKKKKKRAGEGGAGAGAGEEKESNEGRTKRLGMSNIHQGATGRRAFPCKTS
jgi:hypothetical protein